MPVHSIIKWFSEDGPLTKSKFWSQSGFVFGKFPFVGWTRGWYAEDTENKGCSRDVKSNKRIKSI